MGPADLPLSYLNIVGAKRRCIVINWLLGVLFFGHHSGHAHDTLVTPIEILWWRICSLLDASRMPLCHAMLCSYRLESISLPHIQVMIFSLCA